MQVRYDKEQSLMLKMLHGLGEQRALEHLSKQSHQGKAGPTSWLARQRRSVSNSLLSDDVSEMKVLMTV